MDEYTRDYLKQGQRIMLSVREDGSMPEAYVIHSVIGEGGSTVCYEATRERNGYVETGKLKEFYPLDMDGTDPVYCSLERLESGQLVPCRGTVRRFDEMCGDYIGAYRELQNVINENPDNEILKNYIQYGEVLYGCLEQEEGMMGGVIEMVKRDFAGPRDIGDTCRATVYIWTPGVKGKGFDEYLAEVRDNPAARPDHTLYDILNTVLSLTDCIRAMHTAGLLHLDIKPSNFLVPYYSDFRINSNSVSIFDINTLHSAINPLPRIAGSKGFTAPEIYRHKADNRTDIYSIGAMLFNAIVISKDIPDGLYSDEYYDNIDQLVRHSALMQESESNSDVRLVSILARILKKCLAVDPAKRYECCSDLMEDLKKAENRIKKYTEVTRKEKGKTDPDIVMQKLLYKHPLYDGIDTNTQDVTVLVVGAGTYGQKFIDICLQTGQLSDVKLTIRTVSNSPVEDSELYLQFRPALKDFVSVKVEKKLVSQPDDSYGRLQFTSLGVNGKTGEHRSFIRGDNANNEKLVRKILEDAKNSKMNFGYVFIALGSDRLNQSVANLFADGGVNCPVCYVSERTKRNTKEADKKRMYPVCVNEEITPETIDRRLEQMAFNTHISWYNSMNIDMQATYNAFLNDRYSYASSMAFALSIKYKLHSVGIDIGDDYFAAAQRFEAEVLSKRKSDVEARQKFITMVALEHRRWVLNYVTAGWTAPTDEQGRIRYEECVSKGKDKDNAARTHVCIVHSTEQMPLMDEEYTRDNHAKWNETPIDPKLDPLDRLSLELHQCYRRAADKYRATQPLQGEDLNYIWQCVAHEPDETVRAFKQFQFCLKNILAGVESYSRQYDYYKGQFTRTLGGLESGIRSNIEDRLKIISKAFKTVIEGNLYRDYKANDIVLVSKIPFILTHRLHSTLAMAFEDGRYQNGRNEAVFANVASASMLSPAHICYFYNYNEDSTPELFTRKLSSVINFLDKRDVHTEISLVVAWRVNDAAAKVTLYDKLNRLMDAGELKGGNARFVDFDIRDCADHAEVCALVYETLKEKKAQLYDGTTQLFESQINNGALLAALPECGVGYFEFDWKRKQFNECRDCEYLKFIDDDSYIRINDMFALMNAVDNRFNLPEFAEDYEELWKIYTGKYMDVPDYENAVGNWNRLCGALAAYEDKRQPLARILPPGQDEPRRTFSQFMPDYTFKTVQLILEKLIKFGIIDEDSQVSSYTSDTCKVDVKCTLQVWNRLMPVFARPQMLLGYYGVNVAKYQTYNSELIRINCNDMEVTDLDLDVEEKGKYGYSMRILEQLQSAGFINQLVQNREHPEMVSFTYSSPRMKKLLTTEGEILEVFIYYEVLKSGYFDDVACGYEFRWEEGDVKNELDCVLVKGFRTIIVECKATHTLKLEYYHKLHSISEHFGIGTTKVLVGNTYRNSNSQTNRTNDMQRSRGSQLNIITISDKEAIENIGQTLQEIMQKH